MLNVTSQKAGINARLQTATPHTAVGQVLKPLQVVQAIKPKFDAQMSVMQRFYVATNACFLPDTPSFRGIDRQRLNSDFLQRRSVESSQNFIKFEATIPKFLQKYDLRSKYQAPSIELAQKAIEMSEVAKKHGEMRQAVSILNIAIEGADGTPGLSAEPVLKIYRSMFILEHLAYDPVLVQDATTTLQKALSDLDSKDPNLPLFYNRLAIAYSVLGDHRMALYYGQKLNTMNLDPGDQFDVLKIFARADQKARVFEMLSVGRGLNLIYQAISDPDVGKYFTTPFDQLNASAWLNEMRDSSLRLELEKLPELKSPETVLIYEERLLKSGMTNRLAQTMRSTPSFFELPNYINQIQTMQGEVVSANKQFVECKKAWRGELINALEAASNIPRGHWFYQRAKVNLLDVVADGYIGKKTVGELWDIFFSPEKKALSTLNLANDFKNNWYNRMQAASTSVSGAAYNYTNVNLDPQIRSAIVEYRQATDCSAFRQQSIWPKYIREQEDLLKSRLSSNGVILEYKAETYLAPHVAQMFFERYIMGAAPFFRQGGTLDAKFREEYIEYPYYGREGGGRNYLAERVCSKWSSTRDLMEEKLRAIIIESFSLPAITPYGVKFPEVISTDQRLYLNSKQIVNKKLLKSMLEPAVQFMKELAKHLDNAPEHRVLYNTLNSDQSWTAKARCLIGFVPPSCPTLSVRGNFLTRTLFSSSDERKFNREKIKFETHAARYKSIYEVIERFSSFKAEGFQITPTSIGIFLLAQGDEEMLSLLS